MNCTHSSLPSYSGYSATSELNPNSPRFVATGKNEPPQNRQRKSNNGPRGGDPLGNAVVEFFRAGEHAVATLSSAFTWLLPQPNVANVTNVTTSADPSFEHPFPHANDLTINETLLAGDFGYVGEVIGGGLQAFWDITSLHIGPPGAAAAAVTEEPPGQCPMDTDGSPQCAKELRNAASTRPSLSTFSLAHLKKLKKDFNVVVSKSLKNRPDQTLSNVVIVIPDYDHYSADMQKLINDTLAQYYESNDKFLAETAAGETPAPVYCRGVPASHCSGIDDPVENKRLLALAKKSTDAGRAAQNFIAKLSSNQVQPTSSKDYGVVKDSFIKAFGMVREGKIEVTGKNAEHLVKLIDNISTADSEYLRERDSPASQQKRHDYLAQSLKNAAAGLNGEKAFAVVGFEHIGGTLDNTGMEAKLLGEIDCVILHQKKYKPEELKSSRW